MIYIIKILPISTASNERFFSFLERVKTHLRTTMGDEKLNDLMIGAVENEEASNIDLQEAVNAFSHIKTRRYSLI